MPAKERCLDRRQGKARKDCTTASAWSKSNHPSSGTFGPEAWVWQKPRARLVPGVPGRRGGGRQKSLLARRAYTPLLALLLGEVVGVQLRARFNGMSYRTISLPPRSPHQIPGLLKGEPDPGIRDFQVPGWDKKDFARPSMLTAVMEKPRMNPNLRMDGRGGINQNAELATQKGKKHSRETIVSLFSLSPITLSL